jgi:hypothetical protein
MKKCKYGAFTYDNSQGKQNFVHKTGVQLPQPFITAGKFPNTWTQQ